MSASEIDFASSFSALALAAQSLPSRQKGRGEEMEKTLEDVTKNTTALLADCVEQLSKESGSQAQLAYTTAKIDTCLKILKFTRDE